ALVRLDDLLRDGHAEARSLLLGREEGIEDALDLVRRDAAAVVAHAHGGALAAVLDEQVDAAALRHGPERVDGVVEDVGEYLPELLAVGDDRRAGDVVP